MTKRKKQRVHPNIDPTDSSPFPVSVFVTLIFRPRLAEMKRYRMCKTGREKDATQPQIYNATRPKHISAGEKIKVT